MSTSLKEFTSFNQYREDSYQACIVIASRHYEANAQNISVWSREPQGQQFAREEFHVPVKSRLEDNKILMSEVNNHLIYKVPVCIFHLS